MYLLAQGFNLLIGHPVNNRILERFHEKRSRSLRDIAVKITYKPIFNGDLNGMFLSFSVQEKGPEGTLNYIIPVLTGITWLVNELALFDPGGLNNSNKSMDLLICQFYVPGYILKDTIVII